MKTYTLRPNLSLPKVYLYRKPVDFRKGHHGLGAIIEQELAHDPFSGTRYVFIHRQHNKLKALFWEDNGFVLYYKALAEETIAGPERNRPCSRSPASK